MAGSTEEHEHAGLSEEVGSKAMSDHIERVLVEGIEFAIILRSSFHKAGIHFFTPGHYSQQLGYMCHKEGHVIEPHVHRAVERAVHYTQEVLFLRKGRLRVDFYGVGNVYRESRELGPGDVILLAGGGHGFEALEAIEMIEIKQGPYAGDEDKIRFPGIDRSQARIVRRADEEIAP